MVRREQCEAGTVSFVFVTNNFVARIVTNTLKKHDHGSTREDMAAFVVQNRANTLRNPKAYWWDTPLTVAQYLDARMVADPFCIYDCDIPVETNYRKKNCRWPSGTWNISATWVTPSCAH